MDNTDQIDHAEHEFWRNRCPECETNQGCEHTREAVTVESAITAALRFVECHTGDGCQGPFPRWATTYFGDPDPEAIAGALRAVLDGSVVTWIAPKVSR